MNITFLNTLCEKGYLKREDIDIIINLAKKSSASLEDILAKVCKISKNQLLQIKADTCNAKYIDIASQGPIEKKILDYLPYEAAVKLEAMPIEYKNDSLIVAVDDPSDLYKIDDLSLIANCNIVVVLADIQDIKIHIEKCYKGIIDTPKTNSRNSFSGNNSKSNSFSKNSLSGNSSSSNSFSKNSFSGSSSFDETDLDDERTLLIESNLEYDTKFDIVNTKIKESVLKNLDKKYILAYNIIPFNEIDGKLFIAIDNLLNLDIIDNVSIITGKKIEPIKYDTNIIKKAIDKYFGQSDPDSGDYTTLKHQIYMKNQSNANIQSNKLNNSSNSTVNNNQPKKNNLSSPGQNSKKGMYLFDTFIPAEICNLIDFGYCLKSNVIAIAKTETVLKLGMSDVNNSEQIHYIEKTTGLKVEPIFILKDDIQATLKKYMFGDL